MQVYKIVAPSQMELVKMDRAAKENEIKVKLKKAVITSTDIAIYQGKGGKFPIVPIGLAVGLVSEASKDSGFRMGERVVISPYVMPENAVLEEEIEFMGCDVDGNLGDYSVVPKDNVFILPEGIPDEEAVFIDYIAMAEKALEKLGVDKKNYVAILGSNTFGIILAQLCMYYQAIPIIIDNNAHKIQIAQNCGIYYTVNSDKEDVIQSVNAITGGNFADCSVFECKEGNSPVNIIPVTKSGGKVGIVSANDYLVTRSTFDVKSICKKQLSLIGINNGYRKIASAINLLVNKAIKFDGFIESRGEFADIPELFKDALENNNKIIKTLISF